MIRWVYIDEWDKSTWVGFVDVVVRVDGRGRVLIPKGVREALGIKEGGLLRLRVADGRIVLEPLGDVADKYYGVFKAKKWPRDLDEFLVEVAQEWWGRST